MKKFSILFSFILLFTLVFACPSFATDNLPSIPDTNSEHIEYFIFNDPTNNVPKLVLIYSDTTLDGLFFELSTTKTSIDIKFLGSSSGKTAQYILTDGSWEYKGSSSHNNNSFSSITVSNEGYVAPTVYYSTLDIIYKRDSSVFFQKTPLPTPTPMTVEMMVAMETPIMAEKIIQAMTIILLCGVGCLALVIGLNLFGKVFRIFQVK